MKVSVIGWRVLRGTPDGDWLRSIVLKSENFAWAAFGRVIRSFSNWRAVGVGGDAVSRHVVNAGVSWIKGPYVVPSALNLFGMEGSPLVVPFPVDLATESIFNRIRSVKINSIITHFLENFWQ
jgi:hypothetical protein